MHNFVDIYTDPISSWTEVDIVAMWLNAELWLQICEVASNKPAIILTLTTCKPELIGPNKMQKWLKLLSLVHDAWLGQTRCKSDLNYYR